MRTLKAIAVAIALFAIAANPVVVLAIPCCCTNHEVAQRSCCDTVVEPSVVLQQSCCANNPKAVEVVRLGGCCCIQGASTSTILPDAIGEIEVKQRRAPLVAFDAFNPNDRSQTARFLDRFATDSLYSGPLLLALYCTWLK